MSSHEAPDQPEQQQRQNGVAQPKMPVHPVSAHVGGDDLADDADHQGPVEQAGGQIPDADGVHEKTSSGDKWIMDKNRWSAVPAELRHPT
ncbi:hypothetical protein D9M69_732640 [compost metagenome]